MTDENWPCVPRTGRRLATLRFRYRFYGLAHLWCHRLHVHGHNGVWPCFEWDDIWFERFLHDQHYHDQQLQHMVPVEITGPPR